MKTACRPKQPAFQLPGRREVIGRFDGGRSRRTVAGCGGREVDQRFGMLDRLAGCLTERPSPFEESVVKGLCQPYRKPPLHHS